jgi:hypothetical protein
VAPFTEELKEGLDRFGHVHGIDPFLVPALERDCWRGRDHNGASGPFPVASANSSGQAAAAGEQEARAAAQMMLTFISPL